MEDIFEHSISRILIENAEMQRERRGIMLNFTRNFFPFVSDRGSHISSTETPVTIPPVNLADTLVGSLATLEGKKDDLF